MSTTGVPITMAEFQPAPTPSFPAPPEPRINQPVPTSHAGKGLRNVKAASEYSLREYINLQQTRRYDDPVSEDRLRRQREVVLADLRALRSDVSALVKASESHRWGRWALGGFLTALIPGVRKLFRRPSDDEESSNDTEYAFKRSKSLVSRISQSVRSHGTLASVALFVVSVLYVFQAEVSIRVAKTTTKRLKRIIARIEIGDEVMSQKDLDLYNGWRWRVLLWKS